MFDRPTGPVSDTDDAPENVAPAAPGPFHRFDAVEGQPDGPLERSFYSEGDGALFPQPQAPEPEPQTSFETPSVPTGPAPAEPALSEPALPEAALPEPALSEPALPEPALSEPESVDSPKDLPPIPIFPVLAAPDPGPKAAYSGPVADDSEFADIFNQPFTTGLGAGDDADSATSDTAEPIDIDALSDIAEPEPEVEEFDFDHLINQVSSDADNADDTEAPSGPRTAQSPSLLAELDQLGADETTNSRFDIKKVLGVAAVVGVVAVGALMVPKLLASTPDSEVADSGSTTQLPFSDDGEANLNLAEKLAGAVGQASSDRCDADHGGIVVTVHGYTLAQYHSVANDTAPVLSGAVADLGPIRAWNPTNDLALFEGTADDRSLDWASTASLSNGQAVLSLTLDANGQPVTEETTVSEVKWAGGVVAAVELEQDLVPDAVMLTTDGDVWGWVDRLGRTIRLSEDLRLAAANLRTTNNLAQPSCGNIVVQRNEAPADDTAANDDSPDQ